MKIAVSVSACYEYIVPFADISCSATVVVAALKILVESCSTRGTIGRVSYLTNSLRLR
jgi:hypothetical protein